MKITEFTITGLHGYINVRLPIKDNKIVIVGVNGIGKSTVLNMLYYFISRQWVRLTEYQFDEVSLKIGNRRLRLTRAEVENVQEFRTYFRGATWNAAIADTFSARAFRRLEPEQLEHFLSPKPLLPAETRQYAQVLSVPREALENVRRNLRRAYTRPEQMEDSPISKHEKYLDEVLDAKILFLPTYRRIEKELEQIFPEIEEEIRRYAGRRGARVSDDEKSYVELVEFGMDDVRRNVGITLNDLKNTSRASLNSLASSYLQDVIRGKGDTFDQNVIHPLDDGTLESILSRVEEETLNEEDKHHLMDVIGRIKAGKKIEQSDKYVAHYFSKLVDIMKEIFIKELPIVTFASICNKYLVQKEIIYDETNYDINIILDNEVDLELHMLSSGEKQIVSLFSHLYLSTEGRNIVVIDEPELSLSADWQMQFLPDILASGTCEFLAAVTHSPFIFDNELDNYAVDLRDCIEKTQ